MLRGPPAGPVLAISLLCSTATVGICRSLIDYNIIRCYVDLQQPPASERPTFMGSSIRECPMADACSFQALQYTSGSSHDTLSTQGAGSASGRQCRKHISEPC